MLLKSVEGPVKTAPNVWTVTERYVGQRDVVVPVMDKKDGAYADTGQRVRMTQPVGEIKERAFGSFDEASAYAEKARTGIVKGA